jgi:glycerophosphoryl diester phosphodiesterase
LYEGDVPENSIAAFVAAADAGYAIELDVHPSADGEAIVFHDDDLERMTGSPGRVQALRADELRQRRLLGTGEHVPVLGEVFDVVAGRVPIMIEIKNHRGRAGAVEPRVAALLERYRGPATVTSFNPQSVAWFAGHIPGVLRGQTAMRFDGDTTDVPRWLRAPLGQLRFNPRTRPHYVSYALGDLPTPWTDAWRARGRPLIAWTARTEAELSRARDLADNLIFEGVRPPPR